MRAAEKRVQETGAVLRPGARPLLLEDELETCLPDDVRPLLAVELLAPVMLLVGFGATTLVMTGSVKIVEAFMLANGYLIMVLALRGRFESVEDVASLIVKGASSVMAALLIVALAYSLNAVTTELGAADAIITNLADNLTPNSLVAITFLIAAAMSFATGTSWGTFALVMPLSLPLAFEYSGGEITPLISQTVAAVAGGGIFGDHASPVSDTSVLSSVGAGSDHIDHVVTQLPYALVIALVTVLLYAFI